jgi:hypothetical protein
MSNDNDQPNEMLAALMLMAEQMLPMIEFCEGQKAVLVERGWSPSNAEDYARQLLIEITKTSFAGVKT